MMKKAIKLINIFVQYVFVIFQVLLLEILQCGKCKNYLCLFCAQDFINTYKGQKSPEDQSINNQIVCPNCNTHPFILVDVRLDDPVL